MTKVKIDGKEYSLRFDMEAMENVEDEFGSIDELQAILTGDRQGKQVKGLRGMFRIMANSALTYEGQEPTVTGQEIMRLTMAEMRELSKNMMNELRKSMGIKLKSADADRDGIIVDDDDDDDEKNVKAGDK